MLRHFSRLPNQPLRNPGVAFSFWGDTAEAREWEVEAVGAGFLGGGLGEDAFAGFSGVF